MKLDFRAMILYENPIRNTREALILNMLNNGTDDLRILNAIRLLVVYALSKRVTVKCIVIVSEKTLEANQPQN